MRLESAKIAAKDFARDVSRTWDTELRAKENASPKFKGIMK